MSLQVIQTHRWRDEKIVATLHRKFYMTLETEAWKRLRELSLARTVP